MDIGKLVQHGRLFPKLAGFSSLMDIGKLVPTAPPANRQGSFSSLMDIGKLVRNGGLRYLTLVLVL